MPTREVTRFTDSFAKAIDRLYKSGGFALAFGFAGFLLMLTSLIFERLATARLVIGALFTLLCLAFFLYTTLTGNAKAVSAIRDNKEAIDAVQDISIELTRLVNTLQAYGFKNLERINKALQNAIPALQKIPVVGPMLEEYGLDGADLISQALVDNTDRIERLVSEVEDALINANHRKLKEYATELAALVVSIRAQLKATNV